MSLAYNELYLPLAQRILGDMFDFAVNTLEYRIEEFHKMFIVSGMAKHFEIGNPTYVAGKNGCEIAKDVVELCGLERPVNDDVMYVDKSVEYWIGWSLAYYQWQKGYKYADIEKNVSVKEMYSLYSTLHEADISLFVDVIDAKVKKYMDESRLKRLRKYMEMSQKALSKESGVPIRQIQLFEQKERDINKTQGDTLNKLSKALHCDMEDLLQI